MTKPPRPSPVSSARRRPQASSHLIFRNVDDSRDSDGTATEVKPHSSSEYPSGPQSLEGTLLVRRKRNIYSWKRRYVVLNLTDGGSVSLYQNHPSAGTDVGEGEEREKRRGLGQMFTKKKNVQPKVQTSDSETHFPSDEAGRTQAVDSDAEDEDSDSSVSVSQVTGMNRKLVRFCSNIFSPTDKPGLFIPPTAAWTLQDVDNDASLFRIMIPPCAEWDGMDDMYGEEESSPTNKANGKSSDGSDENDDMQVNKKEKRGRRESSRSLYFRCPGKGNEKALWIKAAIKLNRLSSSSLTHKGKKVFSHVSSVAQASSRGATSRTRSVLSAEFAKRARSLERSLSLSTDEYDPLFNSETMFDGEGDDVCNERTDTKLGQKEYKVFPTYAYPHRWMTYEELHDEMLRPSSHFHDLRTSGAGDGPEIGTLRVEVLGCQGLPKLDRFSNSDPVCYLVCGSHAFATDVIPDRLSPMWPRKSRRACVFPLHHAYAQLFVGVFDDDGINENDDFAGRVVVDVARLRPSSTYDVTLPLRLSAFVYARRPRGTVRLRFRLDWFNERAAVLSYLPMGSSAHLRRQSDRQFPTTVQCADLKSFRNVAITVHGVHMPGRFTTKIFKATMREFSLYRVMLQAVLKDTIEGVVMWRSPVMSLFIFLGWMHCVYWSTFSLVPSYVLSCIVLFMFRNYWRYNVQSTLHCGLAPLTIEEMLWALVRGGQESTRPCMRSLDVKKSPSFSRRYASMDNSQSSMSKSFSRLSSFIDDDSSSEVGPANEDHAEFPFSDKDRYPKISVKEALVVTKRSKEDKDGWEQRSQNFQASFDQLYSSSDFGDLADEEAEEFRVPNLHVPVMLGKGHEAVADKMGSLVGPKSVVAERWLAGKPNVNNVNGKMDTCSSEQSAPDVALEQERFLPALPEQDCDVRVTRKKLLRDELVNMKDKLQEMTMRTFDDRIYVPNKGVPLSSRSIGNNEPVSTEEFGYSRVQELDRHLELKNHPNPVIAKIAVYLGPLVEMMKIGLCANRATFNVFMWQDPYLSFWFTFGCLLLALLLAVFPWRLFLFVAGVVCVGPQNWVVRVLKESSKKAQEAKKVTAEIGQSSAGEGKKESRRLLRRFKKSPSRIDTDSSSQNDTPSQSVFKNHLMTGNGGSRRSNGETVDPSTIKHVVVPYSPLLYSRFYDWPPERAYANVRADLAEQNLSRTISRHPSTSSVGSRNISSSRSFGSRTVSFEDESFLQQ